MNERLRTCFDNFIGVTGTLGSITISNVNQIAGIVAAVATATYMIIRAAHAWRNYREGKPDRDE